MRKALVSFSLAILLLSIGTPTYAIFGLSKCEKVEKQIREWEREEIPLIQRWNFNAGKLAISLSSSDRKSMSRTWQEIVDLEVKVYGLQRNNPKCFTITQRDYTRKGYASWKKWQMFNKFADEYSMGTTNGRYIKIIWDSIYNQ